MPYIPQSQRAVINHNIIELTNNIRQLVEDERAARAGLVNYAISKLLWELLGPFPRYLDFNELMGTLECAKQELYRRLIIPYENTKITEHGDIR